MGVHHSIQYRSYKDFNEEAFVKDLENVTCSICSSFNDPNDALNCWKLLFMEVVNQHAPLKEKRVKHPKQHDWFNEDIQQAC